MVFTVIGSACGVNFPRTRKASSTGYHARRVKFRRMADSVSRTRIARRSPLACARSDTGPALSVTRSSDGWSCAAAAGAPSTVSGRSPAARAHTVRPRRSNTPASAGNGSGSTRSLRGLDPKRLSPSGRKNSADTVSQPSSAFSRASRSARQASISSA